MAIQSDPRPTHEPGALSASDPRAPTPDPHGDPRPPTPDPHGVVAVIGITDAGAASLLPESVALVKRAELLCGGERHLGFFPDHPGERFVIKANLDGLAERLCSETRPAVVLASGDPGCYGIGPWLVERLGSGRVCILPNVGSIQLAFARLGLAWHDAALLTAHGRDLDELLPAALLAHKAAILTDAKNTPAAIARALLAAGDEDALGDVFEHLGGPEERHVAGRLSDLAGPSAPEFDPLNLLVVRHEGAPRPWPLGLPEQAFVHRRGLITKAEVRAVSLAKLRLHERGVLWDVGAGCGSLAIEAGALLRHGHVYAVERDADQLECLAENRRRFAAGNVHIVAGEAPAALEDLPAPDAVFVGGSGGYLEPILGSAAGHLKPGGRIVANLATLEHLHTAEASAPGLGLRAEVVQISVARGADVAGLTRLAALNPVFIVVLSAAG